MAAALIGRDTWGYGTVSVIAGSVLLVWGAWLNRAYFRERMNNRGALRRGDPPKPPAGKTRFGEMRRCGTAPVIRTPKSLKLR